jgi:hypothetical protein
VQINHGEISHSGAYWEDHFEAKDVDSVLDRREHARPSQRRIGTQYLVDGLAASVGSADLSAIALLGERAFPAPPSDARFEAILRTRFHSNFDRAERRKEQLSDSLQDHSHSAGQAGTG